MLRDEAHVTLNLEGHLETRIIGQSHALEAISRRIRTSRAGIEDPGKPVGVFLLVGPSGVGKTETALALSDLLYGGERNLITINMSEFQEPHTVSTLKGSPPGYVGYGEGGVLTEAVRRRPYSVVLLDEVEKAHPDVLELFYQVFDKGVMEDGEGRQIDFKNNIIVLTTNAGTETLMKLCADPETVPDADGLVKALKPELNKIFKPAFLGRTVIIPYFPIRDEALKRIIRLKLGKVERRLRDSHRIELKSDDALLDGFAGDEGVSTPFFYTLDLLSEDASIDAKKLLRSAVVVTLELADGGPRIIHGLVRRFVQLGRSEDKLTTYRAEVVPWLWFL